jgi:IclR family transcriptional regulator, KDG regulon repressor
MALLDGLSAVYGAKIDSPGAIRMYSRVGRRLSMHSTGLGKAMLAYLPQATVNAILDSNKLPRHTSNTIVDRDTLLQELIDVRSKQYAMDREENEEGIHCIAVPLFDQRSNVMGALSIAALKFRTSEKQLVSWLPELRACSQEASRALRLHRSGG